MNNNNNNILIEKWVSNTLSEAELKQFKATDDYELLTRIMDSSANFQAPTYDVDKAYEQLVARKNKSKSKNWWQYGIAASVILLIGFFTYTTFFATTTFTTNYGEQLAFNLPDGSVVTLNAKSSVTYNKYRWKTNRNLQLTGEAFFDVAKGKKFVVHTSQGNVSVMGTEFIVKAHPHFFKVVCYEGKVKVEDALTKNTQLLTPSKGYQRADNNAIHYQLKETTPAWLKNKVSTFKSVPLKFVLQSLENQYHLQFQTNHIDVSQLFTGSFPNDNQEVALQTVLKSVNLSYKIQENRVILQE